MASEVKNNIHVPKDKKLAIKHVYIKTTNHNDGIIFYDINVKTNKNNWIVTKRYSEFEALNTKLQRNYNEKLPVLPDKHYKWITDHTNPKFIEARRALLDNYCKKLIKTPNINTSQFVINFFHLKNNDNNNSDNNGASSGKEEKDTNNNDNPSNINDDSNNNDTSLISTSYEYPDDQEITSVKIDSTRKMTDHVLYQITLSNSHARSSDSESRTWTVLKRFGQFYEMDVALRKSIEQDNYGLIDKLPPRPERHYKFYYDHMDDNFIEKLNRYI